MNRWLRRLDALEASERLREPMIQMASAAMAALASAARIVGRSLPRGHVRVLDLGCGALQPAAVLRDTLGADRVRFTILDGDETTLQRASDALGDSIVAAHALPLDPPGIAARLGDARFDIVLSVGAAHRLSDRDKRALFRMICAHLAPHGALLLLDIFRLEGLARELGCAAGELIHERATSGAAPDGAAPEGRAGDRPAAVEDHLLWLRQDAHMDAACAWRGWDAALLVARRGDGRAAGARWPGEATAGVVASVADTIGDTPLVALDRLCRGQEGSILLKLEMRNPGLSKKDRIALDMVRAARRTSALRPGQPLVELTSGNTGAGLAIACAILGHPFVAVMSAGNSIERARMMMALGAEVVLVPQHPDSVPGVVSGRDLALVEERARAIVLERGAYRTDQFEMEANVAAHEHGTGAEILRQTGGRVDAFVDFVGTGGTFTGVARALKHALPAVRTYVVEPTTAPFLAGGEVTDQRHRIQGGGYSRELPLLDPALCDGYLAVNDDEAIAAARRLARVEGIFGGFSTGANVAAAEKLLAGPHRGETVVCLACDSGLKYLSTDLYP
ncbi:pyridoxal-phosphate dependent enzyme [Sorangium sp. So ce590]|uniref:pyridoxal-phosphate dependent enzyme n=1 Tax=Sorangium sp. So ce590 TaxID=3133317 RepID=UPI003F5D78EC